MKNIDNTINILDQLHLPTSVFRHLHSEEFDYLANNIERIFSNKPSFLYHEGNKVTGCYFILSGIIKIFKTGADGKEQIIRFAKPGDLISFRSVFSNEPACTTAQVHEDSTLLFISTDTIIHLVKGNGLFSLDLLHLACKELGEANEYITDIAQKSVRERLAEVLLKLMHNFGLDSDNYLTITLTREELANIVGTATESVIRLLSEFKEDQLIELQGRKIKFLNLPALIKKANI